MSQLTAEILAIGDELTTGVRTDTNSAWLSQRLAEIGWRVVRHTTVADEHAAIVSAFAEAVQRSRIVISTGGLGPTADDLTRQALAQAADVPLVRCTELVDHIRSLFARSGRPMPESNLVQADLPEGSQAIPNAHGTAPGVDMLISRRGHAARVFCLPGVPAEMREMWERYVAPAIADWSGDGQVWLPHTINCFGAGESQIESMLPGMIDRHRQPRVGITASMATISLRITACGPDQVSCRQSMQPTIDTIYRALGDLIFSEGEATLADVVVEQLQASRQRIAICDVFLGGDVGAAIQAADRDSKVLAGSLFIPKLPESPNVSSDDWLAGAARRAAEDFEADIGIAISPIRDHSSSPPTFDVAGIFADEVRMQTFPHAGHPALIHERSVKQVLNFIRLTLKRQNRELS
ncbi:MAG TPA: molybdopterin-binding protein [Pirellulaceae bacterium]|nr:molybdopterin-binding protein [Pirellulaceae bacterium]